MPLGEENNLYKHLCFALISKQPYQHDRQFQYFITIIHINNRDR